MTRIVGLVALVGTLFIPLSPAAEVQIPASCRVKNRPPGRCGWCAVETLARHLHLKKLHGITQAHATRTTLEDLEEAIAEAGVSYRIQRPGDVDTSILSEAIKTGVGAAVGFRELYPGAGGHIVTLVDITDNAVKLIDPNDSDGRTRTMSLDRFLYWWDGFALVLEREATVRAEE
jgi:ABC-type bacteriocin/lantibiotic exporter with double-glycine peptidase domain